MSTEGSHSSPSTPSPCFLLGGSGIISPPRSNSYWWEFSGCNCYWWDAPCGLFGFLGRKDAGQLGLPTSSLNFLKKGTMDLVIVIYSAYIQSRFAPLLSFVFWLPPPRYTSVCLPIRLQTSNHISSQKKIRIRSSAGYPVTYIFDWQFCWFKNFLYSGF